MTPSSPTSDTESEERLAKALGIYFQRNGIPQVLSASMAAKLMQSNAFDADPQKMAEKFEQQLVIDNEPPPVPADITLDELLSLPFEECVNWVERELVTRALKQASGNKSQAAEKLGIRRQLLYAKMSAFGLK